MKEQFNPFAYLANLVDPGQYTERPLREPKKGDTGTITPIQRNPLYGVPADLLQALHNTTIRNPEEMTGAEFISNMAGIPALAKTLDRLSGGFQLHSGSGQATQMLPETRDALLAVAPFAVKPAVAAAKATVPAAKAVGRGALAAAQSDTAYDLANRVASATGASPLHAIKPKGGNWAPAYSGNQDSVIRSLRSLRQQPQNIEGVAVNKAAGENLWSKIVEEGGQYNPTAWLEMHRPDVYNSLLSPESAALNRWLDKKLTPYVRNEMGTPDDPIRLAHEKGYTHNPSIMSMEENSMGSWVPQRTADARSAAGFPDEGFAVKKHAEAGYPENNLLNTRKAEEWETISDKGITQSPAAAYQDQFRIARDNSSTVGNRNSALRMAENNPWIEKLSPETPLYKIDDELHFASDLGFNHMMDELRASLSPNSELPAHLRLTPETLNKVNVADAVKRVSEINDWRALEAEKAERAGMLENLNSNARLADPTAQLSFVEKPGMTWVDIPEVVDEKGTQLCTSIGKAGGWCTMNADTAQAYGSGDKRLVALLDAEGRPHAQAMISTSKYDPSEMHLGDVLDEEAAVGDQYYRNLRTLLERRGLSAADAENYVEMEAFGSYSGIPTDVRELMNELSLEAESMIPKKQIPLPDIQELKPPGNAFSSDRANVYKKRDPDYQKKVSDSVVKFLNSGEWGEVNDLYHYGITDVRDKNSWLRVLQRVSPERDIEKAMDNFSSVLSSNPDLPRFMTDKDIAQLLGAPPAEGYAEGGAVKSDFFIDPSSYAQSRSKQMFPKQKSEWTQQDAARHMLASGMMAQKFGPTVAKIAGLAHEHGNAPVKTIGYMLGIGKMPPDYDQDLHNNALGVQLAKEAKSQEDLESRIQAILNSATKQPTPGQPWIGRPNIPNQISDYARGGKVSTNPFDHLV